MFMGIAGVAFGASCFIAGFIISSPVMIISGALLYGAGLALSAYYEHIIHQTIQFINDTLDIVIDNQNKMLDYIGQLNNRIEELEQKARTEQKKVIIVKGKSKKNG